MLLRSMYGYDADALSDETGLLCKDPSLTLQDQKDDADINVIVRRFGIGQPMPGRSVLPIVTNGDFVEAQDLHTSLMILKQAEESFAALPAEVRGRFENDPEKFVDFCSSTKEDDVRDMIRYGLAVERVVPKEVIQKVEIVNGLPPAPKGKENG